MLVKPKTVRAHNLVFLISLLTKCFKAQSIKIAYPFQCITMRIPATAQFKDFIKNHSVAPYKDIKLTRQSFFMEWVLLRSDWRRTAGILRVATDWFPVHSSCLPPVTLQELLIAGNALPLTLEMEEVMNEMFVWGQDLSYFWYSETLERFAFWTRHGLDPDRQTLVREVIELHVKAIVNRYFLVGDFAYQYLIGKWWLEFEKYTYSPSKSFHAMVQASINYTNWCIAQYNYHGQVVAPTSS